MFGSQAQFYFNVVVINIIIRAAIVPEEIEIADYWDLSHITDFRPFVYHISFGEEDDMGFIDEDTGEEIYDEDLDNWMIEVCPHQVVVVNDLFEQITYWDMFEGAGQEDESYSTTDIEEYPDPEDFWKLYSDEEEDDWDDW